jgi:hypothetical protein
MQSWLRLSSAATTLQVLLNDRGWPLRSASQKTRFPGNTQYRFNTFAETVRNPDAPPEHTVAAVREAQARQRAASRLTADDLQASTLSAVTDRRYSV